MADAAGAASWANLDSDKLFAAYNDFLGTARKHYEALRKSPPRDPGASAKERTRWLEENKAAVSRFSQALDDTDTVVQPLASGISSDAPADFDQLADLFTDRRTPAGKRTPGDRAIMADALFRMFKAGHDTLSDLFWGCLDQRVHAIYGLYAPGGSASGFRPIFPDTEKVELNTVGAAALLDSKLQTAILLNLSALAHHLGESKSVRAKLAKDVGVIYALLRATRDRCLLMERLKKGYKGWANQDLSRAALDLAKAYELLERLLGEDPEPAKGVIKSMQSKLKIERVPAIRLLTEDVNSFGGYLVDKGDDLKVAGQKIRGSIWSIVLRLTNDMGLDELAKALNKDAKTIDGDYDRIAEIDDEARIKGMGTEELAKWTEAQESKKREDAASVIAAHWRGSKVRRTYDPKRIAKELARKWGPVMEAKVAEKQVEFEVLVPTRPDAKVGVADNDMFGKEIRWKDIAFRVGFPDEYPASGPVPLELVVTTPLPAEFSLRLKPWCSAVDNAGKEYERNEQQPVVINPQNTKAVIGQLDRSLWDRLVHPRLNNEAFKGSLLARIRLDVVKYNEPSAWKEFNQARAERETRTKQLRQQLEQVISKEKVMQPGFLNKQKQPKTGPSKEELTRQLAVAPLVGSEINTTEKLVFYAVADARKLRNLEGSSNVTPVKWKAETAVTFDVDVHPATGGAKHLGAYLTILPADGSNDITKIPSSWRRSYQFKITLLNKGTTAVVNKDISVETWADFVGGNLFDGRNSMGLAKAFPADVLKGGSGFTMIADDSKEYVVLRVEVKPAENGPPPSSSAKLSPFDQLFLDAQEKEKEQLWPEAAALYSQAIEMQPQRIGLIVSRARCKLHFDKPGALSDVEQALPRTKLGAPERLQALLIRAQLRDAETDPPSGPAAVNLDLVQGAIADLNEVLKYEAGKKVAVKLKKKLEDREKVLKVAAEKEAQERAKAAPKSRQCPNGRNCKDPSCTNVHPKGWVPPKTETPAQEQERLRLAEEERQQKEGYRTIYSWATALLDKLPKEPEQTDLVRALFPPRRAAQGDVNDSEEIPSFEEAGDTIEELTRQMRRSGGEQKLSKSITGMTAAGPSEGPRGAGKGDIRVLVTAHTARELTHFPELETKIMKVFSGRARWYDQKKVDNHVFEGRLNHKERIFYIELEANRYLITAIVLNHKGFSKIIEHAVMIKASLEEEGTPVAPVASDSENDEEAQEHERQERETVRLKSHAEVLWDIITKFKMDCDKNPDMGAGFFLPRRYLGNLDMLIETDPQSGRSSAVLTRQELEAIKLACEHQTTLYIKGSAGNGKTTVLSEIAKAQTGAVVVLPTTRLRDQVLRSYPEVKAVTVLDRLNPLWPKDWRRVVFADFAQQARSRLEGKEVDDQIANMWVDRYKLRWYREWKQKNNLKDEEDLWEYLKGVWDEMRRTLDSPEMAELSKEFAPMLIDEAQSLTPLQIKLLALSSGQPNTVVVGLDSKQSVGRESAARRSGVRRALFDACQAVGAILEHKTVNLSINFRCPVGVLQVLDAVLQRWLKPNFKEDFDDFAVDAVIRSSLWDSPPVILCQSVETARRLIRRATLDFVVLHTSKQGSTAFAELDPLLTLGIDDCRGLEFEELCVLDRPLAPLAEIRTFRNLEIGAQMTEDEREQCRDTITSWLVLMTRCMFGAVWIEEKRHPVVKHLFEHGGDHPLLLEVETEEDITAAVVLLRRARQDATEDGGSGSILQAITKMMGIIGDKIETYKSFNQLAINAAPLVRRATGKEDSELEQGLLSLPAVIDRVVGKQTPLLSEPKHNFVLKHFGPLVYRMLKRRLDELGRSGANIQKGARDAMDEAIAGAEAVEIRLKALGFDP
ncbi:hypothetical protein DFJ74DRAFT_705017 [Hyaloraphidium curvatum]|nr:hypothetical protein DFJ74DRAFT_705017 [Hyaloraphidium curvatum]